MTAPITPSGGGGEHTPWCGQLSCDLRNDTLAVSTDAMVIIDSNGVAWATLLPSAGGFYDHAAFIVEAVNSHATLKARIEELQSDLAEATCELDAFGQVSPQQYQKELATKASRIDALETALRNIACFDDAGASHVLLSHGTYYAFDEPWSVRLAREALASKGGVE